MTLTNDKCVGCGRTLPDCLWCYQCEARLKSYQMKAAERDALAERVEKLEAALKTVKTWCELNRREGSVIYKPVCEALKGGK